MSLVEFLDIADNSLKATRFSSVVSITKLIVQNLSKSKVSTVRELYYHDVDLFNRNQSNLNYVLDLISASMGVRTDEDLMIQCTPKGLVYGGPSILLTTNDSIVLRMTYEKDSMLIPRLKERSELTLSHAPKAIIVFEKEAVFKSFCHFLKSKNLGTTLILLTAKGYPDRSSKRFLHTLGRAYPNVPMLGFVDSDVYGLAIYWNFLWEEGKMLPTFRISGVFLLEYEKGWLTINPREFGIITGFLKRIGVVGYDANFKLESEKLRRELTRGLLLFKKAEINVIDNKNNKNADLNELIWKKVYIVAKRNE